MRVTFYREPAPMDDVKVEVELARAAGARANRARMRRRLGLRVRVAPVKPGILAPLAAKARRVVDLR